MGLTYASNSPVRERTNVFTQKWVEKCQTCRISCGSLSGFSLVVVKKPLSAMSHAVQSRIIFKLCLKLVAVKCNLKNGLF